MERKGILMRLREDGVEMYEKYHAEVWPEMLAILKKAGIENYSIWREGTLLFAYYEVEDMQKASEILGGSTVHDEWRKLMRNYLWEDPTTGQNEWFMKEVFYLE